jgi:predicted nucleic acid-binding protein
VSDLVPIISDASPLIALAKIGLLDLLRELYEGVVIPAQVLEELHVHENRPGSRTLLLALEAGWLRAEALRDSVEMASLMRSVGPGEAAAILLAEQRPCRFVLLDEKRGRAVAKRRNIPVAGTGTILLAAKKRALIESVPMTLDQLAGAGYRLSPGLRAELTRLAGETIET